MPSDLYEKQIPSCSKARKLTKFENNYLGCHYGNMR